MRLFLFRLEKQSIYLTKKGENWCIGFFYPAEIGCFFPTLNGRFRPTLTTPGIPDKRIVYLLTRSYYNRLACDGVHIYEYTPGFCHAKMSVSDDIIATCGTINMDYRSLYHHFEDGCLLIDTEVVADIKNDFDNTLFLSRDVTDTYKAGRTTLIKIGQLFLRLLAPLM